MGSNAQAVASDRHFSPFIVQRNPGTVANQRTIRHNRTPSEGRRYEVLERGCSTWFLLTVLTVLDGGQKR